MNGSSGGNDSFWPGYVDAISNLVLSLLFVVAILTIAVFMFAVELGRRQGAINQAAHAQTARKSVASVPAEPMSDLAREQKAALESEIRSLKKEVKALKSASQKTAAQPGADNTQRASTTPRSYLNASEKPADPEKDIARIQSRPSGIVIVFTPDAVALTGSEITRAKEALSIFRPNVGARVEVHVPTGFSEVKRLAFYRAMSVRNLLIELGIPSERIEVSVIEAGSGGDSARVTVRSR